MSELGVAARCNAEKKITSYKIMVVSDLCLSYKMNASKGSRRLGLELITCRRRR